MNRAYVAALLLALAAPRVAHADVTAEARSSYAEGKRAYDAGQFSEAARAFSHADELAPNDAVLELAVTSAMRADEPVLGMQLVDRAESRGATRIVAAGRETFKSKVGRVELACPSSMTCDATVDDETITVATPRWVRVGDHHVVLRAEGVEERMTVHVESGRTAELRPTHVVQVRVPVLMPLGPMPQARERPVERGGQVHPAWFYAGLGLTAAAGTAAIASGIDTLALHRSFESDRTNTDLAAQGNRAELRTNVLLGATAVLAVATGVMGYLVLHTRHD